MKYKKNKMNKKDTKYKLCIFLDPRDRKWLCQIALKISKCLSSITVLMLLWNGNKQFRDWNGFEGSGLHWTLVFLCLVHPSDCSSETSNLEKTSPEPPKSCTSFIDSQSPCAPVALGAIITSITFVMDSMIAGTELLLFLLTLVFLAHGGHPKLLTCCVEETGIHRDR